MSVARPKVDTFRPILLGWATTAMIIPLGDRCFLCVGSAQSCFEHYPSVPCQSEDALRDAIAQRWGGEVELHSDATVVDGRTEVYSATYSQALASTCGLARSWWMLVGKVSEQTSVE
jgi:hypothetical protein